MLFWSILNNKFRGQNKEFGISDIAFWIPSKHLKKYLDFQMPYSQWLQLDLDVCRYSSHLMHK